MSKRSDISISRDDIGKHIEEQKSLTKDLDIDDKERLISITNSLISTDDPKEFCKRLNKLFVFIYDEKHKKEKSKEKKEKERDDANSSLDQVLEEDSKSEESDEKLSKAEKYRMAVYSVIMFFCMKKFGFWISLVTGISISSFETIIFGKKVGERCFDTCMSQVGLDKDTIKTSISFLSNFKLSKISKKKIEEVIQDGEKMSALSDFLAKFSKASGKELKYSPEELEHMAKSSILQYDLLGNSFKKVLTGMSNILRGKSKSRESLDDHPMIEMTRLKPAEREMEVLSQDKPLKRNKKIFDDESLSEFQSRISGILGNEEEAKDILKTMKIIFNEDSDLRKAMLETHDMLNDSKTLNMRKLRNFFDEFHKAHNVFLNVLNNKFPQLKDTEKFKLLGEEITGFMNKNIHKKVTDKLAKMTLGPHMLSEVTHTLKACEFKLSRSCLSR